MIYKAQSPAGFAEEYIVESIWSGRFPPGTILPAERELSELIGVTRTTLREVLQRLARDGWLTIQHGKPTRVNNFWETCGLNILETLARLDEEGIPELVDDLLAARTNVIAIIMRLAIKSRSEKVIEILKDHEHVSDDGKEFANYDYQIIHDFAMSSGNRVFVLMMNGFKGLYSRIGGFYFSYPRSREVAREFYKNLMLLAESGEHEKVPQLVRQYGIDSGKIWSEIRNELPKGLVD
ncbi:fatty acid metabolism transcriptional regulator FadR [Paraneptunicella aestuarii]|uniref:fatty acid metabolism transcriptional regulator FadR n=1 Tax=Paraneptunicella aestuarii TaxID=2831148 RepID=UPI001E52C708|nr:fatty acid metabolism transcriptional regulator FadR [Paraneptunicella aestuarii]UAA37934.1 fatty acid metabolism transcriptional regulator FadR [Paraneptunicella aestuarii]